MNNNELYNTAMKEAAAIARSHIGKAALWRQHHGLKFAKLSEPIRQSIIDEERGGDIVAEEIEQVLLSKVIE